MERGNDYGNEEGHHVLALPYPSQGHINPMLQFCKRLRLKKRIKTTFLLTNFIFKANPPSSSSSSVQFDTISDGFDQGGFQEAKDDDIYLESLQQHGSSTLSNLISKYINSDQPVHCLIYDSFLPWALDVAKEFGLVSASFFTQPCAVNYIYYHAYHGMLTLPVVSDSLPVSIPGMPLLQLEDMPSFIYVHGSYPSYFKLVLNQFLNVDQADFVFVNTFYKLEQEVVDEMSRKTRRPLMTIGPTIPSFYLDGDQPEDDDYGLHLYNMDDSMAICGRWLSEKPAGCVVYVSFGSMACLGAKQMEELWWGLRGISDDYYYLWVLRASEEEKLPDKFKEELDLLLQMSSNNNNSKGLLVRWSPQLQVLSSKAVGCFFSHAGWNSTIEALSLGVPMVVMPQWTDQTTNAKLVQGVWKVGIRVKVQSDGVVGRQEIERCIREVMGGGERGKEMKKNAMRWKDLAKEAVTQGGTSDKNMDHFLSQLLLLLPSSSTTTTTSTNGSNY